MRRNSSHRHGTIRVPLSGKSEQIPKSGENRGKKMEAWLPKEGSD
jgi:hypothetical protein